LPPNPKKNFIRLLFEGHFFALLVCLLVFLVSYPYLWSWNWGQKLLIVLLLGILFAGVISMREIKWVYYTGVLIGSPVFILNVIRIFRQETPFMEFLTLIFIIPFFAYVTLCTLYRVLTGDKVTLDKLLGAAAVYLLMGLTWSVTYTVLEIIQPGNFFIPVTSISDSMIWLDFIYYSFTTLTTLGYGEVHPITHQARSLSILEAVTGVLYVAFLVARLVSMYQIERSEELHERKDRRQETE